MRLIDADALKEKAFGKRGGLIHTSDIDAMSTITQKLDEWCTDCKEYDHEKHCCPRFNRVIRDTVEEVRESQTHCKDCKHWEKFPACSATPELHLCGYFWGKIATKETDYCSKGERE